MRIRIDELLKNAGKTKTWLARKVDVDRKAVQRWNKGQTMPSISNMKQLVRVLNCKPADLLGS